MWSVLSAPVLPRSTHTLLLPEMFLRDAEPVLSEVWKREEASFQSLVIQTKQNINKGITSIYYLPLHFRISGISCLRSANRSFTAKKNKDSSLYFEFVY